MLLTALCCVLVCTALLTVVGKWTGGSFDVVEKIRGERNPDNLLTIENYTVEKNKDGKMVGATRYGVSYTVKDDGRITLSGTNNDYDGDVQKVAFANVTLKPGTYTISGYENAGAKTLGVYAKVGQDEYLGDIQGTFTITQETTVVIGFYVYNKVNVSGKTLYPVLVSGEDAGEFYVK